MTDLRYVWMDDGSRPVEYNRAFARQQELHAARVADEIPDTVLLLEHEPVYTAGKRTEPHERPLDGTPVVDVNRGGKMTWHGPGQLVGYPIVKLAEPVDVLAFVRRLEDALIAVCADVGVDAIRVDERGYSGVWMPADEYRPLRKVGALGLRVASGVTMHGFALNCDCDLSAYAKMVPCGLTSVGVTSLSVERDERVTVADVTDSVQARLTEYLSPVAAHPR